MLNVQDDDLDPMELADHEEEVTETKDEHLAEEGVAVSDPEHELVEDLDKVAVPEPAVNGKKNAHMLPQSMIDAPLNPEDLYDEGCI